MGSRDASDAFGLLEEAWLETLIAEWVTEVPKGVLCLNGAVVEDFGCVADSAVSTISP